METLLLVDLLIMKIRSAVTAAIKISFLVMLLRRFVSMKSIPAVGVFNMKSLSNPSQE